MLSMRYSLVLLIMAIIVVYFFVANLLEAYGDDCSWFKDQLYYYLKNILGLDVPRNFSVEVLSTHTHDTWIGVWESCSYYNIRLLYGNTSFSVGVCVGNDRKIIGLALNTSNIDLSRLNWFKKYTIPGIVYNPSKCLVNITNRPKVLATLLSIVKNVSEIRGVNKYLGVFTSKLCSRNCLEELGNSSIVNETFNVCPGLREGASITLSNGYELDYGFSVEEDLLNINVGLKVNLTRHLFRYEILEITLTNIREDQYVLTSFYWKPYHIVLVTPNAQLAQRLKAAATSYVKKVLSDIIPKSINKSTCELNVMYTRVYPSYREAYLDNTSLLVEYPIVYGVKIECKYNSTADWVRVVDVVVSPYSGQILKTYTKLPQIHVLNTGNINQWINTMLAVIPLTILVMVIAIIKLRKHK